MNREFVVALIGLFLWSATSFAQTITGTAEPFSVEMGGWDDSWELGDVNHDGKVDDKDVVAVIDKVLDKEVTNFDEYLADMNSDGKITIVDATAIIFKAINKNEE